MNYQIPYNIKKFAASVCAELVNNVNITALYNHKCSYQDNSKCMLR